MTKHSFLVSYWHLDLPLHLVIDKPALKSVGLFRIIKYVILEVYFRKT